MSPSITHPHICYEYTPTFDDAYALNVRRVALIECCVIAPRVCGAELPLVEGSGEPARQHAWRVQRRVQEGAPLGARDGGVDCGERGGGGGSGGQRHVVEQESLVATRDGSGVTRSHW